MVNAKDDEVTNLDNKETNPLKKTNKKNLKSNILKTADQENTSKDIKILNPPKNNKNNITEIKVNTKLKSIKKETNKSLKTSDKTLETKKTDKKNVAMKSNKPPKRPPNPSETKKVDIFKSTKNKESKDTEVSATDYDFSKSMKNNSIKKRYFNFEEIKEANLKKKQEKKSKKLEEKNVELLIEKMKSTEIKDENKITNRLAISNINVDKTNAKQLFTALTTNLTDKSMLKSIYIYESKGPEKSQFAILNFEDKNSALEIFNSCTGLSFGNFFEGLDFKVVNEAKDFDNLILDSIEYKNTELYDDQIEKALKFKEKHQELKMNRKNSNKNKEG